MRRSFPCIVCACAIASLLAPAVAAQPQSSAAQRERAAKHYDKGLERARANDCQGALVEFEQSLEALPHPNTEMNMAKCHERLGDPWAARQHYLEAERLAEEWGAKDTVEDAADKRRALEKRLSWVIIRVPLQAEALDIEVTLNGRRVNPDRFGEEIQVDSAVQRVQARADGRRSYEATVPIGKGEPTVVEIPPLDPIIHLPPENTPSRSRRGLGYVGVGVGLGAVVGSLVLGWAANSARDDAFGSGECDRDTLQCTDAGQARMDSAHSRALYATVLASAGVVLAGAGLAVWLTAPKDRQTRASSSLMPVAGRSHLGVAWSGRF